VDEYVAEKLSIRDGKFSHPWLGSDGKLNFPVTFAYLIY